MMGFTAVGEPAVAENVSPVTNVQARVYLGTFPKPTPPLNQSGFSLQYYDHQSYPMLSDVLIFARRYG